jgi:hypothetical protein
MRNAILAAALLIPTLAAADSLEKVKINFDTVGYDLDARAVLLPVTSGSFFEADGDYYVTPEPGGPVDEVLQLRGTLNGQRISYALNPSDPSWGHLTSVGNSITQGEAFWPDFVQFSAGGTNYSWFVYGSSEVLVDPPAVQTPEPSFWLLLVAGIGLLWIGLLRYPPKQPSLSQPGTR